MIAEMPAGIIDGDYLVCLEGEEFQGCLEGGGTPPSSLTFEYTGADCVSSANTQSAFECSGGALVAPATVDCVAKNADDCAADDVTNIGDETTITASKLNPEITITINDGADTQDITIHTSCSQDLLVGQTFGALTLTGVVAGDDNGGASQRVCYDLTIGAEGPKGDPGTDGADGDQGPSGPLGPAGDAGIGGIGSGLVCFSTDQTIGTQGKFIGLGTQGGSHDEVSIITPFEDEADSTVVRFACKVAQGNTARDGVCSLFHDHPDNDFGQIIGSCNLTGVVGDSKTTCMIAELMVDPELLSEKDSLSVFISTAGGSFEGGSACAALIRGAVYPLP